MAVPRWPASLPQRFLLAGYSEELPKAVIRSDMSAGPAKVRRRSTATPWMSNGSMSMTQDQYDEFLEFVEAEIGGGALPFEMPNQRAPGTYWLVRLIPDECKASRTGPRWQVQIKLEVLP